MNEADNLNCEEFFDQVEEVHEITDVEEEFMLAMASGNGDTWFDENGVEHMEQ